MGWLQAGKDLTPSKHQPAVPSLKVKPPRHEAMSGLMVDVSDVLFADY